ncbi:hypothetical protein [Marinoscillum pacificum]|uniref:hypothetical protein n=1 Tax=Marinoscillum pacificum TaxID=392723 RepID=UPI002157AE9E|nr:hypothetical protein [Marinoscillum pacificum]
MKHLFYCLLIVLGAQSSLAQNFGTRIEAKYSIKEISPDKKQSLIVGKVFYDLNKETLIHSQSFPREQILVFKDTAAYIVLNDSVLRTSSSAMTVGFSIYHLLLKNEMDDFGLSKMGFKLMDVEEVGEQVVSKWRHPASEEGYVAITQSQGLLEGIIFYKKKGEPLVKQYFKEHQKVGRYMFPMKIYEIIHTPAGDNKKITTHSEIKIDDFEDEAAVYSVFDDIILPVIRSGQIH